MIIVGGRTASIAFAAHASNSSSPLNTLNMVGVSFGPESPKRQMLVLTYAINAGFVSDTNYVTSVTIGGVAATRIHNPPGAANTYRTAWMTPRTADGGPAGASGNIAVTRSTGSGFNTIAAAVFALDSLRDPSLAYFDAKEGTGNPTAAIALGVPGGGVAAAQAWGGNVAAHTWTGLSEVYDVTGGVGGTQRFSGAMAQKLAASGGLAITAGNGVSGMWVLGLSFK